MLSELCKAYDSLVHAKGVDIDSQLLVMTPNDFVPSLKPFLHGTLAPISELCILFVFSERKFIDCAPVDFLVTDNGHPHPFFNSSTFMKSSV
jgi:hypothetical protein